MIFKNNTIVCLNGGLGNQLFQYAFAKSFSQKYCTNLLIDDSTGFLLDKTFNRKFQLNRFNINYKQLSFFQKILFYFTKIDPYFKRSNYFINNRFYANYLIEREFHKNEIIYSKAINTFLIGYWQSPDYFKNIKNVILKELTPPKSSNPIFIDLANQIDFSNAVAIGVRLYEETTNPESLSSTGSIKTINDINKVIEKLSSSVENPKFYIFCSHKPQSLDELIISKHAVFVTPETGFEDAVDTLWLLTKCKHHIFTNSTFYWWGAFLSANNFDPNTQNIYAADNFLNQYIYLNNWNKF